MKTIGPKEVAAMINQNEQTIRRKAREGEIPGVFRQRRWYFNPDRIKAIYGLETPRTQQKF